MILSSWNVRSLNDPQKCSEVKQFLSMNKVDVVGLVETRVKLHKSLKIQKTFCPYWCWVSNSTFSPRGRVWIGWKHQLYNLVVLLTTEQLIDVRISDKADKMSLYVTVVYGLHTIEDRKPLWSTISQLNITTHPWIGLF
jgi:exonuclease III